MGGGHDLGADLDGVFYWAVVIEVWSRRRDGPWEDAWMQTLLSRP